MFGTKKNQNQEQPIGPTEKTIYLLAPAPLLSELTGHAAALPAPVAAASADDFIRLGAQANPEAVVCFYEEQQVLHRLLVQMRETHFSPQAPFIAVARPGNLISFGDWLSSAAEAEILEGVRLVAASSISEALKQIPSRLGAVDGPSSIKMPLAPEIKDTGYKYFYAISPQLRAVIDRIGELAQNGITRIYLLGAPGAGKTSLAYYYYLKRGKGNFITVNLSAESTGDKAAMKSLLCGHVTGAIPGAAAREGALSFAQEGVCFLDESHGVTGSVMQVLMEVLDSGQYLPFGATAKRALDCAVLFASNRSWETLQASINLDEHARLGAMIVTIPDLRAREEDLLAVAMATLSGFAKHCTSWTPPIGVTDDGWRLIRDCRWHGNTRALIRVLEAAAVQNSISRDPSRLINREQLLEGMRLWEPQSHESHAIYSSYQ